MTIATPTKFQLQLKGVIRDGIELLNAGKLVEALNHHLSIRSFFNEFEPEYLRHFLCNLGLVYYEMGEYQLAINYLMEALGLEPAQDHEHSDIAAINVNIANVLLLLGRPDEAHTFLVQPEEYFISAYDSEKHGEVLETRARAFLMEGKNALALTAARIAVNLLLEYCEDSRPTGRAIRTLAACWEAKRETA